MPPPPAGADSGPAPSPATQPCPDDGPNTATTPPGPWEPVTADGGVEKRVLVAGAGARPPLHARCLVHYDGFLDGDSPTTTPFFSSRAESATGAPAIVVAGRTAALRETGLALAVGAMAVGERAEVRVAPEYGYGAAGSFSFPAVPPAARLRYEVELLAAEPPDEGKELGAMLFEERVEASARRRAAGNAALAAGDPPGALASYRLALSYLDDDLLIQLEGRHAEAAEAEVRAARLNAAAAHLAGGDPRAAVAECDAVLLAGGAALPAPQRAKAHYRRGVARRRLGAPGDAVADLKAAAAAAPGDPAIRRELAVAIEDARAQADAGAALFRGALGKKAAEVGGGGGTVVAAVEQQEHQQVKAVGGGGGAWAWAAAAVVVVVAAIIAAAVRR